MRVLTAIKDYYNSFKIEDNKCLIISDTHIGRLDYNEPKSQMQKNEKGLYMAYNYALKNNIKKIIHAGDLIEGESDSSKNKLKLDEQFDYLKRIYPNLNEIKTYLLLGNHDYNLYHYSSVDIFNQFNQIKNLEIIGVNYSFISYFGNLIKISHECSASEHYRNYNFQHIFELAGHSHMYLFDEEKRHIRVPTLSSLCQDESSRGFLELTDEENEYKFKFLDDNANYKSEKLLSKKLNNKN